MKYHLLLAAGLTFSSVSFAGNGSGWGGAPALTQEEMKALNEPLRALVTSENEIFLRSTAVQELMTKSEKGLPVALSIDKDISLVRPVQPQQMIDGKLELETPDGERVIIWEID